MKQAIAGVAPSTVQEVTVMETWPSISRFPSGRFLGRCYSIEAGFYIFTIGNFIALASIPHALFLYFFRLMPSLFGLPGHGARFRLTNRRVIEFHNEVRIGAGPRWMRVVAGIKTMVIAAIAFVLVQQFWIGWAWPAGMWQTGVTALCAIVFLAGVLPIIAPVPIPVFVYAVETKSIELDRFDSVTIERQPGQEWFDAGDLVFRNGEVETFRLEGVSRPDGFLHTIRKSHQSYVGVKQALARELATA